MNIYFILKRVLCLASFLIFTTSYSQEVIGIGGVSPDVTIYTIDPTVYEAKQMEKIAILKAEILLYIENNGKNPVINIDNGVYRIEGSVIYTEPNN